MFGAQPTGGTAGQSISPSPSILVQDASGTQDTSDNSTVVTLNITSGTGDGGAVLTCSNDENANASGVQVRVAFGTAPFFGCGINLPSPANSPYTLTASAPSGWPAASAPFAVAAPPTAVPTATPTRTATPTPVPATPAPTATPSPPPPPVTQPVGPSRAEVHVAGGTDQTGGVTVSIPAGTFSAPTTLIVVLTNEAPTGATATGATLLAKTIDITTSDGAPLGRTVEIQIRLTAAELAGRDIGSIRGGVGGGVVKARPTRVIDSAAGILGLTVDHFTKFTLFSIVKPGPALASPPNGEALSSFTTTLAWEPAAGATQFQLQVAPFNGDGPGVNLIGDIRSNFVLPAPPEWYGFLPDMTYFWRVRTTAATTAPQETDWSAWTAGTFKTPKAPAVALAAVEPAPGVTVNTLTPAIRWSSSSTDVFYYQFQLSKDRTFNTDPSTATSMVYGALIHGGVATPPNSYRVPSGFPLEPGATYHWRVRPRVQGDGTPAAWTATFTFSSPAASPSAMGVQMAVPNPGG